MFNVKREIILANAHSQTEMLIILENKSLRKIVKIKNDQNPPVCLTAELNTLHPTRLSYNCATDTCQPSWNIQDGDPTTSTSEVFR